LEQLPEIDVDALIMERILNSSTYLMNQIIYHGSTIKDNDNECLNKKDLSSIKYTNLNLERLWDYSSHLTQNRNVSCLCWSEHNHVR
jgi:hypothetical protein